MLQDLRPNLSSGITIVIGGENILVECSGVLDGWCLLVLYSLMGAIEWSESQDRNDDLVYHEQ